MESKENPSKNCPFWRLRILSQISCQTKGYYETLMTPKFYIEHALVSEIQGVKMAAIDERVVVRISVSV